MITLNNFFIIMMIIIMKKLFSVIIILWSLQAHCSILQNFNTLTMGLVYDNYVLYITFNSHDFHW